MYSGGKPYEYKRVQIFFQNGSKSQNTQTNSQWQNIARGTTDPEIDSVTWTKFSDHKAWSADGATCISSKFGHQMAKLALVINLATR